MKPQTVGRVLGVGLRVAGRIAGQRLAGDAGTARGSDPRPVTAEGSDAAGQIGASGQKAGRVTRNVARGLGGFLKPFRRLGGILFLEVTGVFFLLFVVVFGQMAWRVRASYAVGPDHQRFLVAAALTMVFLYLSASSFWRARRK